MGENEIEDEQNSDDIDIDINIVHEQVKSMQTELNGFNFNHKINISTNNEHSNSRFENNPSIIQLKDDEIYNLSDPNDFRSDKRVVQVLRNLTLEIGTYEPFFI